MEVMPEGKNFRLVKEEELPELLEYLSQYLPQSLKFHQTLRTFLNDRVWDFYFYVSKDWPQEPVVLHFPGITSPPNGSLYESFSVFCPNDRLESLQLLQSEDVLIDWTRPLYLNFTPRVILERLEEFYCANIGDAETVCGDVYISVTEPPPLQETELAPEAELRQLRREHARVIHDLYPANDMEAVEAFEKCIEALPAYGVFIKDEYLREQTDEIQKKINTTIDDTPAAWMVQSYYGAMFSMQTLPEFRRKGYGILLANRLTAAVRHRGYIPFVVIRPENSASQSLYLKLGFEKLYQTVRAILKPYGYISEINSNGNEKDHNEIIIKAEVVVEQVEEEEENHDYNIINHDLVVVKQNGKIVATAEIEEIHHEEEQRA